MVDIMKTSDETLLIKNARAILRSPTNYQLIEEVVDIFIDQGRIEQIGRGFKMPAAQTFNAEGLHVLPGVIDTQVHFREPGLTHKEDLESGSRSALLGGVTGFFEMPNTNPSTTTAELFQEKLKRAENRSHTNYAFYFGGAIDNADAIAKFEKLPHCCGVKVFAGSSTGTMLVADDVNIDRILKSGQRRVTFHSEDEFILRE